MGSRSHILSPFSDSVKEPLESYVVLPRSLQNLMMDLSEGAENNYSPVNSFLTMWSEES